MERCGHGVGRGWLLAVELIPSSTSKCKFEDGLFIALFLNSLNRLLQRFRRLDLGSRGMCGAMRRTQRYDAVILRAKLQWYVRRVEYELLYRRVAYHDVSLRDVIMI